MNFENIILCRYSNRLDDRRDWGEKVARRLEKNINIVFAACAPNEPRIERVRYFLAISLLLQQRHTTLSAIDLNDLLTDAVNINRRIG